MKPIIGITCFHEWQESRHRQNDTYINAILKAGGLPILLPCLKDMADIAQHLDIINALVVSGGPDADPLFFGEEPHPGLGNVSPSMDAYEIPLIREALRRDMPILGICRGEQMLNVAAGGTLIQHIPAAIPDALKHQQGAPRSYMTHSVKILEGTQLAAILGAGETRVNTFHHQAVGKVAPDFRVSALAPDGVIEAIESTKHSYAIGVQWHPECMWDSPRNYDALFSTFIDAGVKYACNR